MRYTKYKWMMWLVLLCFSCVNEEQRAVLSIRCIIGRI